MNPASCYPARRRTLLALLIASLFLLQDPIVTAQVTTEPTTYAPRPFSIPGKRASQYTVDDWNTVIDTTWGPGQSAAEQLQIFDTFWSSIDERWPGFCNHPIRWDSVRNALRPQIGSGLSRGRFYALMSRAWLALMEVHTKITDTRIEAVYVDTSQGASFGYRSGYPLLRLGSWGFSPLGAAVTLLPDCTNVVYRAAPGNPLGLEPGDLVLGLEGIPWKRLAMDLMNAGLPVSAAFSAVGSTIESSTYALLASIGWNWGMFDTIDVVKYSSGDTLHLSTAPLSTLPRILCLATDQMPVPGVSMPETPPGGAKAASHGIVQGTNVGYIYVWDWSTTSGLFESAIQDLCHNRRVDGLVIDSRLNTGGSTETANAGFAKLFNVDPGPNYCYAIRNNPADHMSYAFSPSDDGFAPSGLVYDRPIAVLTGPGSWSAGDANVFRLRFHPMTRFFGKRSNGGFVRSPITEESLSDAWHFRYFDQTRYSFRPGEGFLMHNSPPVDEEIWLTRDGVARGEDDVVKRALEWITTLTHAHALSAAPRYARPGLDTVTITAVLANPLGHQAAVSLAFSIPGGTVRDSFALFNDGLHGDGLAGDTIWGARFVPPPAVEGAYRFDLRTDDLTLGSSLVFPVLSTFSTAGPLTCVGDTTSAPPAWGKAIRIRFKIANNGSAAAIQAITANLRSLDTAAVITMGNRFSVPDIAAGQQRLSGYVTLAFSQWCTGTRDLPFELALSSAGVEYWRDTVLVTVTDATGIAAGPDLPAMYELAQNYPNPFNPTTVIRYQVSGVRGQVSGVRNVKLVVYDMLGREVAVLVDGVMQAGRHQVTFDGTRLPTGVYMYRLTASGFVQTKTMLLIK